MVGWLPGERPGVSHTTVGDNTIVGISRMPPSPGAPRAREGDFLAPATRQLPTLPHFRAPPLLPHLPPRALPQSHVRGTARHAQQPPPHPGERRSSASAVQTIQTPLGQPGTSLAPAGCLQCLLCVYCMDCDPTPCIAVPLALPLPPHPIHTPTNPTRHATPRRVAGASSWTSSPTSRSRAACSSRSPGSTPWCRSGADTSPSDGASSTSSPAQICGA